MDYFGAFNRMIERCLSQEEKKTYEERAMIFAEHVGAVEYHITGNKMIFYSSFPLERSTVRAEVNLDTMEEKREYIKGYYPAYKSLIGGRYQANYRV